eukprot:COSAG02_NODE_11488_length_1714_cov_120.055108_2_plen_93_part_01
MAEEGTPPLIAELEQLKPRALKKRASEAGVDEDKIDGTEDADDVKAALIALIVEQEQKSLASEESSNAARIQALVAELEQLKPRALKKRASEA